ncbi:MAG: hypothetical protein IPM29_20435 [Planctomycetes bacterium]|nr:hypothetical protein [Planctomycetota bacterium]
MSPKPEPLPDLIERIRRERRLPDRDDIRAALTRAYLAGWRDGRREERRRARVAQRGEQRDEREG